MLSRDAAIALAKSSLTPVQRRWADGEPSSVTPFADHGSWVITFKSSAVPPEGFDLDLDYRFRIDRGGHIELMPAI